MKLITLSNISVVLGVASAGICHAQAPSEQTSAATIDTVVVVGNRTAQNVRDIPRSVTVISGEVLRDGLSKSLDVGDLLGRLVPGMPTSAEGRSNARGQDQIRGRRFLLMIDGIPQDRTYLDTRQDFKSISAEAIEKIEVIRGGTAIYGLNSTGGIINIITKDGKRGSRLKDKPEIVSSLKILPNNGGALGYDLYNQARGGNDQFNWFIGYDWLHTEGRNDAAGALIPSATVGSADFNATQNLNIKVSGQIADKTQLSYALNVFRSKDHDR